MDFHTKNRFLFLLVFIFFNSTQKSLFYLVFQRDMLNTKLKLCLLAFLLSFLSRTQNIIVHWFRRVFNPFFCLRLHNSLVFSSKLYRIASEKNLLILTLSKHLLMSTMCHRTQRIIVSVLIVNSFFVRDTTLTSFLSKNTRFQVTRNNSDRFWCLS